MIVPAKRTRLLEPTSYPMTSTTTNNNNDNNNKELSQQQFLSNKLYQEDHNHQLLPEFSNSNNNNNSLNGQLQTPQLHLQQLNSSSSSLSSTSLGILSDEQQLLTKDYLRNIEKKIELILENISQRSKGDINESSSRSSSKNDTNSIVLDLPTLVDDSKTEEKNVVTSPLSSLLNHTYPDSIIELVNKLNKISINNPDLDIPPFGKFLKVNNNNDDNNNNNNKVSSYPSPFTSPVSSNNNNNNNHHHLSSSSPLLSSSTSSSSLVSALSSLPQSSSVLSSQLSSVSSSASMSPSSSPSISDTKISSSPQPPPPSKELCHQLIQDYFKKLNPIYPILDRRRFSDVLQSKTIHSQLLINSVLSFAASKFSDDPSIRKTANKRGGIFFDAAKKILDSVYHEPKLETIQALLLLSQSEASISRLNSNYMFLGMAVSMSNSLQLHRVNDSLSSDEAEERSRIFYCVYCRNRWSSFFFAKPYSIDDTDINVPLPSLLNFDRKTRMFFIAYIKLSHILGQIWRFAYTIKPKAYYENWHNHITDQKSTLRQIRSALAKWSKELPEELQYLPNTDSTSTSMKSNDFSVYAGYINMLFYTCILLLHQPYFANSSSSSSKAQSSKSDPYYYNHYNHAFVTSDKFTSPSFQSSTGPIKTCLTAAATITDISRTTRQLNEKAFLNFGFPAYSLMRSITLEAAIVCSNGTNGLSSEHIQEARRLLNDTLEELRHISNVINVEQMTKAFQEMERLVSFTNHSGELYIPLPLLIQFLENMNNNNNSNSSTSTSSNNNNNNNNKDNNNIINNNNIIINNNNNIDVKNNSKNKNNFAAPANPVTKVSNLRRNNSDSSLFKSSNSFAGNNNIINKNNTITSSTKITSNIDANGDMIMENTSPFNNNNNNDDNDLFILSSTPQSLITTPASAFTMTYDLFPTHNTATATAVNNDDNINSDNDNGGDLPWNQQYYDEIFFSTTSYAAIIDSSNIDDNVL